MRQHILTAALAVALLLTVAGCGSDKDKGGTASHSNVTGAYAADQDGHVTGYQENDSNPLTRAGQDVRNGAEDVAKGAKDAANDAKNAVKGAAKDAGNAVKNGVNDVKNAAEDAKDEVTGKDNVNTGTTADGKDQTQRLNPTGNTANGGVTPSDNPGNGM